MVIVAIIRRGALREITACVAQAVFADARLETPGLRWRRRVDSATPMSIIFQLYRMK